MNDVVKIVKELHKKDPELKFDWGNPGNFAIAIVTAYKAGIPVMTIFKSNSGIIKMQRTAE